MIRCKDLRFATNQDKRASCSPRDDANSQLRVGGGSCCEYSTTFRVQRTHSAAPADAPPPRAQQTGPMARARLRAFADASTPTARALAKQTARRQAGGGLPGPGGAPFARRAPPRRRKRACSETPTFLCAGPPARRLHRQHVQRVKKRVQFGASAAWKASPALALLR